MLVGDTVIGRWTTPRQRTRLTFPLYALLAPPYLAFLARPGTIEAAALVAAVAIGCTGALADVLPARTVMALAGIASLLATGVLLPRLRSGECPARPAEADSISPAE